MVNPVLTVNSPVLAPAGTVAAINVVPVTVSVVAGTPLNRTIEELLKPCPRILTVDPTFPEEGETLTNGGRLAFKLKKAPQPEGQAPLMVLPPAFVSPYSKPLVC